MRVARKILVIGGVAAGPKAAVRVKRLMSDAEVTILDQDSFISYGGCGIPYYVSGDVSDEKELRSTSFHMVRDESFFARAKGVKVITSTRALHIDRKQKTVEVQHLPTGNKEMLSYDLLLLATGSEPVLLPIPGNTLDGVFTISDLHKAIAIKERIAKGQVSKAVVIGGGAIGIEMAEAVKDLWGIDTTIVEYMDQLLPKIVSWSISSMLTRHLRENGVTVHLGESVQELIGKDGSVTGVKTDKRTLEADLVIMAAGVKPRSQLARDAGLNVSMRGGIVVNERMQTNDPEIFAAGDCVEIRHTVTGKRFTAPFGSLANKEGRVAADNMAGIPSVFKGSAGCFIMKAFSSSIGSAGLSIEAARAEGYDADSSLTAPSDRAHFYPEQKILCLELVFDRRTRKVLGLQGFGAMNDGLMARINAASVALAQGASIDEFCNLEMAYAPPFSTAIDALNAAAYVADNLCDNRMRQIPIPEFLNWLNDTAKIPERLVLDVRHAKEADIMIARFGSSCWQSLPYDQVRERYQEIPKNKELIIFCNAGSRAYEVQIFLDSIGLGGSRIVPGGYNFLRRIVGDQLT